MEGEARCGCESAGGEGTRAQNWRPEKRHLDDDGGDESSDEEKGEARMRWWSKGKKGVKAADEIAVAKSDEISISDP